MMRVMRNHRVKNEQRELRRKSRLELKEMKRKLLEIAEGDAEHEAAVQA